MNRLLALIVVVLGMVCLGIGVFFVYQGISKNNWLTDNIEQEKITLGLTQEEIQAGRFLENSSDLQRAGDMVREQRHSIAPTYQQALGGSVFDPADPKQLIYSQAMNLENYLYLGVLGFGVTQMALGAGVFMIVVAVALAAIGVVLWRLSGRPEPAW